MTARRIQAFLLSFTILLPAACPAQDPPEARPSDPGSGFIHATVTWPSGEAKTGFLRWDDEEIFWDDLFHCGYRHLVWSDDADLDQIRKERRAAFYESHGRWERLAYARRMFLSRFGDLRSIEIHDGADDFAVTADGARHQIGGYANDAGSILYLDTGDEKPQRIRWNDLSEIVFSQAPAGSLPGAERLYGQVQTTTGVYEGFIQWDRTLRTSRDMLNGKVQDQFVRLSMGEIRTITRARANTVDIVLKDGAARQLDLGSGHEGVAVEVFDLGRVRVPWNRCKSVTFREGQGSGPGRAAFANADPLRGQVTDVDGQILSGRLVFDLDEAFRWDLFNGIDAQRLEYAIPFHNLARIESGVKNTCRVTLRSGQILELGENQDTGEDNAGVLVFGQEEAKPEHLSWSLIRMIEILP